MSPNSNLNGSGIGLLSLMFDTMLPFASRPASSSPGTVDLTFKFGLSATGATSIIILDEVETALSAPTVVVVHKDKEKLPEKLPLLSKIFTPVRSLVVNNQSPVDVLAPLFKDRISGRPRSVISEVPDDGVLFNVKPKFARSEFVGSAPPSLIPSSFDAATSEASTVSLAFASTQKTYSAGVIPELAPLDTAWYPKPTSKISFTPVSDVIEAFRRLVATVFPLF